MKHIICVTLLLLAVSVAWSQEVYTSSGRPEHSRKKEKSHGFDPGRIVVGGSATLGFGDGYADLGISPVVGYMFTNDFTAGIGFGYEYLKTQQLFVDPNTGNPVAYPASATIASPNIWARYKVYRNIFVQAIYEYDIMHYSQYNYDLNAPTLTVDQQPYNTNVSCLLLGAGIFEPIGGRAGIIFSLNYDVLQNPNSPYYSGSNSFLANIIPNVGFIVGF